MTVINRLTIDDGGRDIRALDRRTVRLALQVRFIRGFSHIDRPFTAQLIAEDDLKARAC
jgi:hypothetical protein